MSPIACLGENLQEDFIPVQTSKMVQLWLQDTNCWECRLHRSPHWVVWWPLLL